MSGFGKTGAIVSLALLGSAALLYADGAALAPFTEEAQLRGIDYTPAQFHPDGHGVSFIDLDDDGDADLVAIGSAGAKAGVFENDGTGFFIDHTLTSGIGQLTHASSIVAADYDLDGDLDLFFGRRIGQANRLYRNDGNFLFTDVTEQTGWSSTIWNEAVGSAWGDYDNDGYPDLYISNRAGPNLLYHNLGDGSFEEVAVALGVDRGDDPTLQSSFFDFDQDGDADLYIGNDKGLDNCALHQNYLFENVGGTFVDITESSGTQACVGTMGLAIGDFTGNGHQDLYCTNCPPGNVLLTNGGTGVFTHQEDDADVGSFALGWAAVFFDFDNDATLDLYVCNSDTVNRLYRHQGGWPCNEVAAECGVEFPGFSNSLSVADIDLDGDLDLIVSSLFEPLSLFINHEGARRSWARFDVVGEGSARFAIGANVRIRTAGTWQLREVIAGNNYKSQNELILHYGLDAAVHIDEIEVLWPGGATRTLLNLPANQTWTLYPDGKLGDADQDGAVLLNDFVTFADCYDQEVVPGCEVMDFDGSGFIDDSDFDGFLTVYEQTPADCDGNGTLDFEDILQDPSADLDGDGQLDGCTCPGDLNGDNVVNAGDLAVLLGAWGAAPNHPADLNDDGSINASDLAVLLGAWGTCP